MKIRSSQWVSMLIVIVGIFTLAAATLCVAEPSGKTLEGKSAEVAAKSKTPKNAATVNGKTIPYADLELELSMLKRRFEQQGQSVSADQEQEIRGQLLEELINQELFYQDSQKKGIKVDLKKVEDEFAALKARYPQPKQFQQILSDMKMTESKLKGQMAQKMAIRALIDKEIISTIQIEEPDARTFYDQNPAYFEQPEQVHARHILVKVENDATPEVKEQARKKILDLKKRINAGEDFAEVAKANSDCPSSANGGDLGYFARSKMVKPFAEKAFAMGVNEVSDPVETNFGYHVIKVLDKKAARTAPFDEVKDKIVKNLRNQAIQTKVDQKLTALRKTAAIKSYLQ